MKTFSALCLALGARTAVEAVQQRQQQALAQYLQQAPRCDAAWAVYLLAGGKARPAAPLGLMRDLACELACIQPWLFEACHAASGDLAETVAHLAPMAAHPLTLGLANWMEQRIGPLRALEPAEQAQRIREDWAALTPDERVLYVKLVSGSFRSAVTPSQAQHALASTFSVPVHVLAQRLPAYLALASPADRARFEALIQPADAAAGQGLQPWAWACSDQLQVAPETLGDRRDWQVEWALQGLRVQVLRRGGQSAIWSRTDELLNSRLPEVAALAEGLPEGTAIDGQLVLWPAGAAAPLPVDQLQARLRRKTPAARAQREAPVRLVAFDLLELHGQDLRQQSLAFRRSALQALAQDCGLILSEPLAVSDWADVARQRNQSRERGATGLVLKPLSSRYGAPHPSRDSPWWVWKLEPLTVRAVLLYAEGAGGRNSAPASFSFAAWSRAPADASEVEAVLQDILQQRPPNPAGLHLVPIVKVTADNCGASLARMSTAAREHSVGAFGPVRSLLPSLVVELVFEGVSRSARHKSGLTLLAPHLQAICEETVLAEIGTVPSLLALLGDRQSGGD